MNRVLNWLRVVFRIEFRNVLANRLRTILLAALIGLPVAAIVAGNNLISNTEKTPAERAAKILAMQICDVKRFLQSISLLPSFHMDR